MSAICKCGELAHFDSYARRVQTCVRCEEPICSECAWCGDGATGEDVHEGCLESDEEIAHFEANRKLRAAYEMERIARNERIRLRWNAEHPALSAKAEAEAAFEFGIGPHDRLPLWKDEERRSARVRVLLQKEHDRIEQEEMEVDMKSRMKVRQASAEGTVTP